MKNYKILVPFLIIIIFTITGCDFLGGVFKTGIGVGVAIVLVVLVLIFLISRRGKGNKI